MCCGLTRSQNIRSAAGCLHTKLHEEERQDGAREEINRCRLTSHGGWSQRHIFDEYVCLGRPGYTRCNAVIVGFETGGHSAVRELHLIERQPCRDDVNVGEWFAWV